MTDTPGGTVWVLRHSGRVRDVGEQPNDMMLAFLVDQVDANTSDLVTYDQRPQTRREPNKYTELIGKYQTARQFAPLIIKGFSFSGAASAASLLRAVDLLRIMYDADKRSLPDNPPTGFNLRKDGVTIPDEVARHIAPLGWAHVGLTGDYQWNMNPPLSPDRLRPLRKHEPQDAA